MNVLPILISALFCLMPSDVQPEERSVAPRASVTVTYADKQYTYTDDMIVPSDFTVAEQIEQRRINAPTEQKLEIVDDRLGKGADYKAALLYCFPRLEYFVKDLSEIVDEQPVDASVVYKNGKFSIKDERDGRVLDTRRLFAQIYYSLKYGSTDPIRATTLTVKPNVWADDIRENLVLRGEYTTEYKSSSADRAHNVAHAAGKLDGAVISPHSSLSFNSVVGERSEKNGFKTAKIIVDGKYVDGIGGGACQASTAVYNAALRAGLVCKANAHSICPSYCPPGLDAMISSMSDLVIYNNTDHDVFVSVSSAGKSTTVKFFGEPTEYVTEPESVVIKTIDPENKEFTDAERKYFDSDSVAGDRLTISRGVAGYECETYINRYRNGNLVSREKIRENSYKPSPQITAVAP